MELQNLLSPNTFRSPKKRTRSRTIDILEGLTSHKLNSKCSTKNKKGSLTARARQKSNKSKNTLSARTPTNSPFPFSARSFTSLNPASSHSTTRPKSQSFRLFSLTSPRYTHGKKTIRAMYIPQNSSNRQYELSSRRYLNMDKSSDTSDSKPRNIFHNFAVIHKEEEKKKYNEPKQKISEIHGFLGQKNIKQILKDTNYNRRELFIMYTRFKALCGLSTSPDGIDRATFKHGVARMSVEDETFVDRIYDLVDEDQSDSIEWEEFLTVMSALEKCDITTQVSFFFKVYDLDGDGKIGRQDLGTMFLNSSMLKRDSVTNDLVDAFVKRTFKVITDDEDGDYIMIEDVLKYLENAGEEEDVWDLFGRSMLKDFASKRG